jgi:hypothetical protein
VDVVDAWWMVCCTVDGFSVVVVVVVMAAAVVMVAFSARFVNVVCRCRCWQEMKTPKISETIRYSTGTYYNTG